MPLDDKPRALLELTASVLEASATARSPLEAGLRGLLDLVEADRADAGYVSPSIPWYQPVTVVARTDVDTDGFRVPISDPVVNGVLTAEASVFVADTAEQVPVGPVRTLLTGNNTWSIVVRRIDDEVDAFGIVCIDWVDRHVTDVDGDLLELIDYFVTRIWAPILRLHDGANAEPSPLGTLTAAEHEVVALAARGLTYGEIARERGTSINTVSQQLRAARLKVGARNTAELTSMAISGS
ncbi:MAG: helix-turn-helix transcriptional regulator [Acidimicrobiia bacterium]|nr:helix-turn-helix transcriptional regulator [Acidimicrobiia bacterium]